MQGKYYHLYLKKGSKVTDNQVAKKLNLAIDWFRYDDVCWVIYTTSSLERWKSRLTPLIGSNGRYLMSPMDVKTRIGWMPKAFWDWIKTHNAPGTA